MRELLDILMDSSVADYLLILHSVYSTLSDRLAYGFAKKNRVGEMNVYYQLVKLRKSS